MGAMKHPKERAMGVLTILFIGLPIVLMTSQGIHLLEAYNLNYAIVLSGRPRLEFWLLQVARVVGALIILSGVMMMARPEETKY